MSPRPAQSSPSRVGWTLTSSISWLALVAFVLWYGWPIMSEVTHQTDGAQAVGGPGVILLVGAALPNVAGFALGLVAGRSDAFSMNEATLARLSRLSTWLVTTGALAAAVAVVLQGYSQAALRAAIAVLAIGFVGIRVSARTPARSYIALVLAIVLIAVSLTAILIAPLIALLSGLLLFIAFAGMGRGYQGDHAI